jgi:outer membrane protein
MAGANGLMDAYQQAQQQDQTFQAALHQRDASMQARPQAWAALLPQITAQGSLERDRLHVLSAAGVALSTPGGAPSKVVDYYTTRSYTLSLTQTLFNWSQFETLMQSDKQVAEAQATFRSAQQALISRTAAAYFAVLSAQDTLRADLDAETSFKQQLEQAQKKFEVGLAAITDVRNAQASYDTSTALVIADRTTMDSAKRALGLIIGQPVDAIADLQPDIPLVAPNPAVASEWSQAAREDNPDLMTSFYAAEVARKQVAIYRSQYLPSLAANGGLNRSDSHSAFGDDALDDEVAVTLTWNIFQGGLTTSLMKQASATYQQALAQYELERRTVDQNTRNDYEGVVSGIAGVKANKQAVLSNQTSLDATLVGLRVGTRTEIDVLNARQLLAAAQKSYYQSRYAYLNSLLALKQDAGRLGENDLIEIDRMVSGAATASPPISEGEATVPDSPRVPPVPDAPAPLPASVAPAKAPAASRPTAAAPAAPASGTTPPR